MRLLYPPVTAIILHWQSLPDTLHCLASLRAVDYPALSAIVVNNGGGPEVAPALERAFPGLEVLEAGENLGFAEGNNLGLRRALARGTDYALLLNDDTVVAPDLVARLVVGAGQYTSVAAAGPTIYYFDRPQVIWSAGGLVDRRTGATRMLGLDQDGPPLSPLLRPVDFVSGCTMLVGRPALEAVGLFDPRFFAYYEEVDWCWRARRAGFSIVQVPQARVWHKISIAERDAAPRVVYYMARNRLLYLANSRAGAGAWLRTLGGDYLRTVAAWTLKPRWRGRRAQRDALLRALADYARGRLGRSACYSPVEEPRPGGEGLEVAP